MSELTDLNDANDYLIKAIRSQKQIKRELSSQREILMEKLKNRAHLAKRWIKKVDDDPTPAELIAIMKAQNEALVKESEAILVENKGVRENIKALQDILAKISNSP